MLRNAMRGAVAFGVSGLISAYAWTVFEFPFAIIVPAFIGWYVVIRSQYDTRKALLGGAVGGVAFTGVLLVAMFLALTDGSPLALTSGMSAILAAAVAGALTGWVLGGAKPALAVAGFSAAGMLLAVVIAGGLRTVAPAAVDIEGAAQYAYFALSMGAVSTIVGAAVGAAVAWVRSHMTSFGETPPIGLGRPHPS